MSKKKLPKRRRGICEVCGKKFSYKPIVAGIGNRVRCDEHPRMLYGS